MWEYIKFFRLQLIKAEDSGKLSSTATVNIKVTDVNDKNPEFVGDPYTFEVKEGVNGTLVGFVHATDADEGINAVISYAIPSDLPFSIDEETGEIITIKALDYETQKVIIYICRTKTVFSCFFVELSICCHCQRRCS